jgi:hypothetical protein
MFWVINKQSTDCTVTRTPPAVSSPLPAFSWQRLNKAVYIMLFLLFEALKQGNEVHHSLDGYGLIVQPTHEKIIISRQRIVFVDRK